MRCSTKTRSMAANLHQIHQDMRMHGREIFTTRRGPFVCRFTCAKDLGYLRVLCIASVICIFKMYIIHKADIAAFLSSPLMSDLNPHPPSSPFPPSPPLIN